MQWQAVYWKTISAAACWVAVVGCGHKGEKIRVEGSDTMINVAVAWSEAYGKEHPDVSIEVAGNGSGTGIKALADGEADLANSSRKMEAEEIELVKKNVGSEPKENIVGYDALAVYVHKDNPIDSISLEELAEIYGENGTITNWGQVDPAAASLGDNGEIVVVNRQNSSGTYKYFQEAIMGNRKYRGGTLDQSGSKDVVSLVGSTPAAIGYSGMGYHDPKVVKKLNVSKKKGSGDGVVATIETAQDGSYPITRPLLIYTVGEPTGAVKEYLDWIASPAGQKVVAQQGYVPLTEPNEKTDEESSAKTGASEQ